jgi:hypothetical protein
MVHRLLLVLFLILLPASSLGAQVVDPEALQRFTDEVLADVARIRGLEPKSPIQKGVRSKDEIRSFIIERIESEYPPERIAVEEKLLKMLRVIPDDMDLHGFMLDLLTEQIAGYYDPYTRTFYIADWIPLEMQKPVMAHELVHALQDQHFGLEQFLEPVEGNDDRTLARSALIEGEGLLVMLAYTLEPLGRGVLEIGDLVALNRAQMPAMEAQYKIFAGAPAYLKETLLFPYTYGAGFLQHFLLGNDWSDLSRLYEDLPESTEQILHPEKYFGDRDRPVEVDLSGRRPPEPWAPIYANVLGEFTLSLVLGRFLDEESAKRAAEGWGGDAIELFSSASGRHALLMATVWDSEADATVFARSVVAMLERKHPSVSWKRRSASGGERIMEAATDDVGIEVRVKEREVTVWEEEK